MNNSEGQIEGLLYRGDKLTKYSGNNTPVHNVYKTVKPDELALMAKLPNEESSKVMLHMVDFDPEVRQVLPDIPTSTSLISKWPISPERHAAYEQMWRGLTYVGVLANTAMWLYW